MINISNKFVITKLPQYSMILFIFLNIIAMFLYTGGNINDPSQLGYSFVKNFFSDLGRRYSYSGSSNLVSCVLFNFSLSIVGLTFFILFYRIRRYFLKNKLLISFATFFGMYSGISYVGVAFTPADLLLEEHIFFAHWAFRSLFASSIFYSLLIFKTEGFENKYAYGFVLFGLMVFSYVIYSEVILEDPRVNPNTLVNHVVAQKMIAFWILFSVYIYSLGLGKYLFNRNS